MKKKLKDSFDRGFSIGLRSLEDYEKSLDDESSPYDEYCGSDRKDLPMQFDKYGTEKSCFEKGKRTGQEEATRYRWHLKKGKKYERKKKDDDFWADSSPQFENAFLRGIEHGYSIPLPKNYGKTHDEMLVYCGKRNINEDSDSFPMGFSSRPSIANCFEKGVELAIQMRLYKMHNKTPTPNRILTDDERRKIKQTWPKGSESIIKNRWSLKIPSKKIWSLQMPAKEKGSSKNSPKQRTNVSSKNSPKQRTNVSSRKLTRFGSNPKTKVFKRRSSKNVSRKKTPTFSPRRNFSPKMSPKKTRKQTPDFPQQTIAPPTRMISFTLVIPKKKPL